MTKTSLFMCLRHIYCTFLTILSTALFSNFVHATFSIVACDNDTRTCAAAVATNNLAVGGSVIYAKAGVGAVVTQYETNPYFGPKGLELLAQGKSSSQVISLLLDNDNNFDGTSAKDRQVAVVDLKSEAAVHTGENARNSKWAGSINGTYYTIQGNGLANRKVLLEMQKAFLNSNGDLAERLVAALIAGQNSGGQVTGSMSAALLVSTTSGFPHDIDLRVDASKTSIQDLQQLLNFQYARQMMIDARIFAREGELEKTWKLVDKALVRGAGWDRMWRRAAHLAIFAKDERRAIFYLDMFKVLNPQWFALEIEHERYINLKDNPCFAVWTNKKSK